MATREEVCRAIDGERAYQDGRWNDATTATGGRHSVTEWLVFMRQYLDEAVAIVSHAADPEASRRALENVRKVTAMGVACMEHHGAPERLP